MADSRRRRPPSPPPAAQPSVRVVTGPMFIDTAAGTFKDPRPPPPPAMSRREFEAELQRLLRAYASEEENPGSMRCEGCRRCVSCMFCTDCEECYRCTHSTRCKASTHLT